MAVPLGRRGMAAALEDMAGGGLQRQQAVADGRLTHHVAIGVLAELVPEGWSTRSWTGPGAVRNVSDCSPPGSWRISS